MIFLFPKKQITKFHAEFPNFMHNLVWKHLKLIIPLIQLGDLGLRCKVPKRVGRPAAKRYLVHFELRKAAGESNFMCIFTEEIP